MPRTTRVFQRTPAKRIMVAPTAKVIRAVPRSGCLCTSSAGRRTRAPGMAMPAKPRGPRRGSLSRSEENQRASTRMTAILASSEGWKFTGPKLIQRRAPITILPFQSTTRSRRTTRP